MTLEIMLDITATKTHLKYFDRHLRSQQIEVISKILMSFRMKLKILIMKLTKYCSNLKMAQKNRKSILTKFTAMSKILKKIIPARSIVD